MTEAVPKRCPECDGAMIDRPRELRCVRCGPPGKPKDTTFQELLDSGAQLRINGPRQHACSIRVEGTEYEISVGYRGVLLQGPRRPLAVDMGTVVLLPVEVRTPVADKPYWDHIRDRVSRLLPGHPNLTKFLWDRVKAYRMAEQAKGWRDVLSEDIVKWAGGVLQKASEECDCVDNYRVARIGNSSQQRRYRRQKEGGCCGSSDFVLPGPDGNRYLLGFNYGH